MRPRAAPPIGVAVDVVVLTVREERLEVLLFRLTRAPLSGRWALPGGRILADETVEQAAARELEDKTGLVPPWVEQLYTYSDPARDPLARCISVAHLALVPPDVAIRADEKYSAVGWYPVDKTPPLAFDHRAILQAAVQRLRGKLAYTNVAFALFDRDFTLGELQRTYEAALGRSLDARNFQRKVRALGLVEETGEVRVGEAHRPGRLYRFSRRRLEEVPLLA